MHARLPSYLRTQRLKSGLSQRELAFLLGSDSGAKVSRLERQTRHPNLEAAFACEALFGVSSRALFPGRYAEVEAELGARVRVLEEQLKAEPLTPLVEAKLSFLSDAIGRTEAGALQT
jgi:transcriptional regulator with XRE-family HTH domain